MVPRACDCVSTRKKKSQTWRKEYHDQTESIHCWYSLAEAQLSIILKKKCVNKAILEEDLQRLRRTGEEVEKFCGETWFKRTVGQLGRGLAVRTR